MDDGQTIEKTDLADFLGDISDFYVLDLRNNDLMQTTEASHSTSLELSPVSDAASSTAAMDQNNPFLNVSVDNEAKQAGSSIETLCSTSSDVKCLNNMCIDNNKDTASIQQMDIGENFVLDSVLQSDQNATNPISNWEDDEIRNNASLFMSDNPSTHMTAYNSCSTFSDSSIKSEKDENIASFGSYRRTFTKVAVPCNLEEPMFSTQIKSEEMDPSPGKPQLKSKAKVTFGGVEKKYFHEHDTPTMDALLNEDIFHYRKFIKLQEEYASASRKILKLEKQVEDILERKNTMQEELLQADKKLSKYETRESLYLEKEAKSQTILRVLQDELNKAKEGALREEKKAARLERMIDEINCRRRRDLEELEKTKRVNSELEKRLRGIEMEFELNKSTNLLRMKEVTDAAAKLEHEREENSELKITIECLRDKLRNAEETVNKIMREKATLQGEIQGVRFDMERWKRDVKVDKMKQDENHKLVDRYRTQYQEQKDVIETILKSRRFLESEIHENVVLAEKRETENMQQLEKISDLESQVRKLKKKNNDLCEELIVTRKAKKKSLDNSYLYHYFNGLNDYSYQNDTLLTLGHKSDEMPVTMIDLFDKIMKLEEENRCLRQETYSDKLSKNRAANELNNRQTRAQAKEIELQTLEKSALEMEILDLKKQVRELSNQERDDKTRSHFHRRTYSNNYLKTSELSNINSTLIRKDLHQSEPDLSISLSEKTPRNIYSPKLFTLGGTKAPSMPELSSSFETDQPKSLKSGYPWNSRQKYNYNVSNYNPVNDKEIESRYEWMTPSYIKAKYGISSSRRDFLSNDNKWVYGEKESNQIVIERGITSPPRAKVYIGKQTSSPSFDGTNTSFSREATITTLHGSANTTLTKLDSKLDDISNSEKSNILIDENRAANNPGQSVNIKDTSSDHLDMHDLQSKDSLLGINQK